MITVPFGNNGDNLTADSDWDSGTHTGFNLGVVREGEYFNQPISNVLSKEQIRSLELVLLSTALQMLEEK